MTNMEVMVRLAAGLAASGQYDVKCDEGREKLADDAFGLFADIDSCLAEYGEEAK